MSDLSQTSGDGVIHIESMGPEKVAAKISQFRNIYRDAFTTPPWNEPVVNAARFARHLKRISKEPGFHCVAAVKETGGMVGFAFGFPPEADTHLLEILLAGLGTMSITRLVPDTFYLAELAVIGSVQGHGVGGRLHDALLSELGYERALTTAREDTNGYRFLLARGWQRRALIPDFYHPGDDEAPWLSAVLLEKQVNLDKLA